MVETSAMTPDRGASLSATPQDPRALLDRPPRRIAGARLSLNRRSGNDGSFAKVADE